MFDKKYQDILVEISDAEAQDMIERVARFIVSRHLAPAGIMFVESLRPLHGIGSQFLFFVLPFAEILFDSAKYQKFALMIQKEDNLKTLVARIDELDEELNRERRAAAKIKRQRRRNKRRAFFRKIFGKQDNNNADKAEE